MVCYRFLLDLYSNPDRWKEENSGLFYQAFSSGLRVSNIKQYQGGYFTVEYKENESYHWICNQTIDAKDYVMKSSCFS